MVEDRAVPQPEKFFSIIVFPCNNLAEAIERGNYDGGVYKHITEKTVPLIPTEGAKRVTFLPVTEDVKNGEEELYANKFGYTLCKFSPNYLLGAMVQLSESELPDSLKGKNLVAAENASTSVFCDEDGDRAFLWVTGYSKRELGMIFLDDDGWNGGDVWVFLCEEKQP